MKKLLFIILFALIAFTASMDTTDDKKTYIKLDCPYFMYMLDEKKNIYYRFDFEGYIEVDKNKRVAIYQNGKLIILISDKEEF